MGGSNDPPTFEPPTLEPHEPVRAVLVQEEIAINTLIVVFSVGNTNYEAQH